MNKIKWMMGLGLMLACCTSCGKQEGEELISLDEVNIIQNEKNAFLENDAGGDKSVNISEADAASSQTAADAACSQTIPDAASLQTVPDTIQTNVAAETAAVEICIHVCGAVASPGVYTVSEGTRVYTVLEAAGGLTETAAADYLNQAAVLTDGQRVYVPTAEEVREGTIPAEAAEQPMAAANSDMNLLPEAEAKVNLNTATAEQLKTLPGVGDSRAQSIIAYRESSGGFQTEEEIMRVDGIKEGMYSKLKDLIRVR